MYHTLEKVVWKKGRGLGEREKRGGEPAGGVRKAREEKARTEQADRTPRVMLAE